MAEVTAIILAAEVSRRMGARNKLLLPVAGVPMIQHMVNVYRTATRGHVLVVTGHQAGQIGNALSGSGAQTVFNANFRQGQPTPVACGLQAAGEAATVLIGLADQPLLTVDDIRSLLAAHTAADSARISIPAVDQRRGNPIVVPAALRARLLADPRSPGCKKFTPTHPGYVQFHLMTSPGFYTDVDTPGAYTAFRADMLEDFT
ncbi:nucleotidyltransferase family protein [uncultured Ruegeria sp.]|uniref:nucleotidyltransferase family protein n=1 Tax=uncultured Ruegeria sp. TaxID=259304 RepID=UPI00262D149F|nr:nucleotidyltransferase family protein [uncultured Ruegeria sp.]